MSRLAALLIPALTFLSHPSSAQANLYIVAEKMNMAYVGVQNALHVLHPGAPCEQLWIATDNGKVGNTGNCRFDLTPSTAGRANLFVFRISGHDTLALGQMQFRTVALPRPNANVAGIMNEGRITANVLRAQVGVAATIPGFNFDARWMVSSYMLAILQEGGRWVEFPRQSGPYFTREMLVAFKSMASGDRLLIFDIKAGGPAVKEEALAPVLLTIQ